MSKRLNIGLMISHLDDDFANAVCSGAIIGAKEIDANLIIFPGRYIEGVYADKKRTEYEYQYNTVFSYAFPESIDVLLVLIGTIGSSLSLERKKEFLSKYKDIPVITLASEIVGYPSVCFDNKSGIRECIEHLINEHRCTNIGFVGGPKTNEDAIERLSVYKETLENFDIKYDENKVVYGRFSPYSQVIVNELLDKCSDLQAIVFANDAMASGAYEVFAERGLEIGKDIFITGFDDSPVAANLIPPLTTVRADASEIGYDAVLECMHYIESNTIDSRHVSSSMVKRVSCGCKADKSADFANKDVFVFNHTWCRSDVQTITAVCKYIFDNYKTSTDVVNVKNTFKNFLKKVFEVLKSDDHGKIQLSDEAIELIPQWFEEILTMEVMKHINHDKLCRVIDYLSRRFSAGLEGDKYTFSGISILMYQVLMRAVVNYSNLRINDIEFLTWQSNSITKDMLLFDSYDDSGYGSITDKMMRLNMDSSYIYIFPETLAHHKDEEWVSPSKVLLKSYHNKDFMEVLDSENQEISIKNVFNNCYIPDNRRFTMILSTIFLNADHYGLFLCELEHDYFYYLNPLDAQLCAAMKIIRLIQDKESIRNELEMTLMQIQEKNLQLDVISKIDELTNVYNRRGFFAQASSVVYSPINEGRTALIIFADLDSLKIINDCFSHEDGDFAIRSAAKILCDSFRSSDIIGRIGGDEFSVLALVEKGTSEDFKRIVRARIRTATESLNRSIEKPYIVNMSVGVYAFNCSMEIELSKILSQADTILYDEKKNKKSILKKDYAHES